MIVREMDNPSLSMLHQEDFSDLLASYGGDAGTGIVCRWWYIALPGDGREELIRGARIIGVNARSLRNLAGIGNDDFVYNFMQSQIAGFSGTALGAFGSAQNGLPAAVVAPSLLFEELSFAGRAGNRSGCRFFLNRLCRLPSASERQAIRFTPLKRRQAAALRRSMVIATYCRLIANGSYTPAT